jgi:hypothetical protein
MEDLKKAMENPFKGLTKEQFQKKCFDIATKLFRDYCISCNEKKFYFVEIEFYYWDKDSWNEKWNRVTYPRKAKATDLFFHLSGIDICFNSYYDEKNLNDKAYFGGILIRSIRDEEGNITAGPWNCMLKILNGCVGGSMPCLEDLETPCNSKENIKETYRSLGEKDLEAEKEIATSIVAPLNLCFYDYRYLSGLNNNLLKTTKIALDKNLGKLKVSPSSYKINRFNR